jgi:hypothetical protein
MPIEPSHTTNILVPHYLYLNVLCDFAHTLKASCGIVSNSRSPHICSQLSIRLPCYCILSIFIFSYFTLIILFCFLSFSSFFIFLVFFLVTFWFSSSWFLSFLLIRLLLLYTPYFVLFLYSFPCSQLRLLLPNASRPQLLAH